MKKILLLFIPLFYTAFLLAQDESYITINISTYRNAPSPTIHCDNKTDSLCKLKIFFNGGKIKGKAIINYNDKRSSNRYRPTGDAIFYFKDSSVHQKYTHSTGILLTYYPTGELKEKMISPINGNMEYKYKYYKNGDIWEEIEAKHKPGEQNLVLTLTSNPNKVNIYANRSISMNFKKTYHSNGQLKSHTFYDERVTPKYLYKFFSPNGKVDKNANYDKREKNGRRYQYYPNGQLKEVSDHKRGKLDGALTRWAENGNLVHRSGMKSGSYHGKVEIWWDNGAPKELSYHIGYYRNGPLLKWDEQGNHLAQGSFYKGKPVGLANYWDTLGNVTYLSHGSVEKQYSHTYGDPKRIRKETYFITGKGKFKNGKRDGKWAFHYASQGIDKTPINIICAVQSYKNNVLDGKVTVYYPSGNILVEANYKNGWLDGKYISYADDGYILTKGSFEKHKKEGLWTRYHYKSEQIHSIQNYINDSSIETIKAWDKDGFLTQELKDNKRKREKTTFFYHKNGSYSRYVTPYGWKYGHSFDYYDNKQLKESTIYKDKSREKFTLTRYYSNGNKSTKCTYLKRKVVGTFYSWYENKEPKMKIPHKNGLKHGKAYFWDEEGNKTVKQYKEGNEIAIEEDEKKLECACSHPPEKLHQQFAQPLSDHTEHEKVKQRTPDFHIPNSSYKSIYAKDFVYDVHRNETYVHGTMLIFQDLKIEMKNGLELNLTACRQGKNQSQIAFSAFNEASVDAFGLRLNNFDLSVSFPKNILQLYDEKQKRPSSELGITEKSSVRCAVKTLKYEDNGGKEAKVQLDIDNEKEACFQLSEIGFTGFLFDGANPIIDLSPSVYSNDLTFYYIKPDDRTGVVFQTGTLYIPYKNTLVESVTKNVFVNGNAIYGISEISTSDNISSDDLQALSNHFKKNGFKIIQKEFITPNTLQLIWKYSG